VAKAALPFLKSRRVALMFKIFEVKGALMEASASERARPASAYFKAPQSFAPSPTIATVRFCLAIIWIKK
jgi:hypothetical protein